MVLRQIWHYLRPPNAENDEGFRRELLRQAHAGLHVIGVVALSAPLVILLARILVANRVPPSPAVLTYLAIVLIGGITFALGRMSRTEQYARLLGWLAAFVFGALVIAMGFLEAARQPAILFSMGGRVVMVLMVALLTLPLYPLQTLSLGISMLAVFLVPSQVVLQLNLLTGIETGFLLEILVVLLVIVLLTTALSANAYRRIYATYSSHQEQLRAAEDLRHAQARVLVSENAASMG